MATGEIRLSILWEWLHKHATLTSPDDETGVKAGDRVHRGALRAPPGRRVREAPAGRATATCHDDVEGHDAADRAGDRRDLCPR